MEQTPKPRLGDLAISIAHAPWTPANGETPHAEVWDAVWEGCYTNYHVCPPGTRLEAADVDYLGATTVQLEHADSERTVFAEMHF